jgi:hypothetical protein
MLVFAHGFGGAQDLPLPLSYAIVGAAVALAISFTVLALAWRTPRFDPSSGGWAFPTVAARVIDSTTWSWVMGTFGLALTSYVGWAAIDGPDKLINPTFGVVYVWLWVGIPVSSILLGPVYRALNPVRTVHRLLTRITGGDPSEGLFTLPAWVGLWPAAVALFAFVWMELVYPEGAFLGPVRIWFAIYGGVTLVGAAIFGDRWIAQADPFEVFSTLVGRLSVFGRRDDGALVVRNPLVNLDASPPMPGLVAVVSLLFGSTAFDSFKGSTIWLRFVQGSSVDSTLLNTLGLIGLPLIIALLFMAATMMTGILDEHRRSELPRLFAHAVVPIVAGYVFAHYLSFLVETGQQTLILLSDPMGHGANLLGTADWQVHFWLSSNPRMLALIKIIAVVVGHLTGVVSSHDRAVRLLPKRHQLTGQLPLLMVMVVYTVTGIWLLFSV